MMNTYANLTNEELVERIRTGEAEAYGQLFYNLRPVILHEAAMYIGKMDTYSLEDLVQECRITCWEVISRATGAKKKENSAPASAEPDHLTIRQLKKGASVVGYG